MSPSQSPTHEGLDGRERFLAFLTLGMAITMAVLDGAIVNVALPTISQDLSIGPADAVWIVNAYQLAVTISLLPLASIADSFGYRRVYWSGLALFTVASCACAFAGSFSVLAIARLVQGFGAAGIMCVNIAFIRFIYPSRQLGRGVGNMAVVVAASSAAGPSVASAILAVASWRWLFLVNLPIGLLTLVLAARFLPKTPRTGHRIDVLSIVLNALTFGLLIAGVDDIGESASLSRALFELAGAAAFGAIFVRRQLSLHAPILPIDLLRLPVFALSMATSIASFASQSLAYVALPFFFETTLHRSETATGLLMTPWPLGTALIAPIAGRMADRYAPGKLGSLGLLVLSAGLALVALQPAQPSSLDIAWRLAICGLGFGFFQSPNNKVIIGSAPHGRGGGASGLQSTGRLVGQSLGTALMAVIFGRAAQSPTDVALWVASALAMAGACASGWRRMT